MQAIRQIIETKKLKSLIDIPDDFSSETVEIIVFPVLPVDTEKKQLQARTVFWCQSLITC